MAGFERRRPSDLGVTQRLAGQVERLPYDKARSAMQKLLRTLDTRVGWLVLYGRTRRFRDLTFAEAAAALDRMARSRLSQRRQAFQALKRLITYVVEGLFGHEDNVGGPFGPLPAGSIQRMTLGSGALHSERNASSDEPMRFIQIWILPDTPDLSPQVEQKVFNQDDRHNLLLEVLSPNGGNAVKIHQDAYLYVASLDAGAAVTHQIGAGRGVYVFLIQGSGELEGSEVNTGDAAKVTDQSELNITANQPSELILVDVPMKFEPVGVWKNYL